jgi:anti-anti-sigma factor
VRRALEEGRIKILVDFSAVTTIDATGVARLTRALTSTCNAGGALKLLRVPPLVYDVLEIIRLHEAFEMFEDESEAIHSFD